jgi:peptide deformylase
MDAEPIWGKVVSILPIVRFDRYQFQGHSNSLRTPSQTVADFGESLQEIVDDMIETLMKTKDAIGLAAPQIGMQIKLAVVNLKKTDETTLVIVNPTVLTTGGKKDKKKESCLSLPFYRGEVERRHNMHLAFQDRFGQSRELVSEGFLARVIAHEVDHLDGVLYVDHISDNQTLEDLRHKS